MELGTAVLIISGVILFGCGLIASAIERTRPLSYFHHLTRATEELEQIKFALDRLNSALRSSETVDRTTSNDPDGWWSRTFDNASKNDRGEDEPAGD